MQTTASQKNWSEISDYYLIGDLQTSALISATASIDWLCLPHVDSDSVFGKLLDQNAGAFSLIDQDYDISHQYVKDTAIVQFTCQNELGQFNLFDYFLPQEKINCDNQYLIREIQTQEQAMQLQFRFQPRPNYSTESAACTLDNNQLSFALDTGLVTLHLPEKAAIDLDPASTMATITITVPAQTSRRICLEYSRATVQPQFAKLSNPYEITKQFWHNWVAAGNYFAWCRDQLVRSAITLKLMQYYPTGAIVAAPTTSLPEEIGGVRNWDYRYVWIRDATYTLYSLTVLGYYQEAERFFDFIEEIVKDAADDAFEIQLMYDIHGNAVEYEIDQTQLSGYKNSSPVRVGNAAKDQFQLDVYGSLIDAHYFATKHDLEKRSLRANLIKKLLKKIELRWQEKDSGIWEVRDDEQHYTYSKVMCWVGLDRAVRMADALKLSPAEQTHYEALAKEIESWIWHHCFDSQTNTLKQHPNTKCQDATNFMFVMLQFLDKDEALTQTIIRNTRDELCHGEVFVHRYKNNDGLPGSEGAFMLCTFWLISAWALVENRQRANYLFSLFEKHIAPHGLMAEEVDPKTGEYLGNYPQAFSHMGYIMSAYYLDQQTKP